MKFIRVLKNLYYINKQVVYATHKSWACIELYIIPAHPIGLVRRLLILSDNVYIFFNIRKYFMFLLYLEIYYNVTIV